MKFHQKMAKRNWRKEWYKKIWRDFFLPVSSQQNTDKLVDDGSWVGKMKWNSFRRTYDEVNKFTSFLGSSRCWRRSSIYGYCWCALVQMIAVELEIYLSRRPKWGFQNWKLPMRNLNVRVGGKVENTKTIIRRRTWECRSFSNENYWLISKFYNDENLRGKLLIIEYFCWIVYYKSILLMKHMSKDWKSITRVKRGRELYRVLPLLLSSEFFSFLLLTIHPSVYLSNVYFFSVRLYNKHETEEWDRGNKKTLR